MPTYVTREIYQDEVVFKEGTKGEVAYILTSGLVEISTLIGNRNVILAILEPVSVFGEMALLMSERKRTATAKALTHSVLVEVTRETIDDYLRESPPFITAVLSTLVNRLKKATEKASKTPNLFLSVCEILNLFVLHGQAELFYDATVSALAAALVADAAQVEEQLRVLQAFNLVEISLHSGGRKPAIYILRKDKFLLEAKRTSQELGGFTSRVTQ